MAIRLIGGIIICDHTLIGTIRMNRIDGLIDSMLKQWDGVHSTILEWKLLTKKGLFV